MSYHRVCCCEPSACVCTGCDFASSYYVDCLQITGSWNLVSKYKDVCTGPVACTGANVTEEPELHDVDVTVTVTLLPGTLTRHGTTACCYRRYSTCEVTYSVKITTYYGCTLDDPCENCVYTVEWSGTEAVTYCHVVVPVCVNGECRWAHTFSICGFQIGNQGWVPYIDSTDCAGGFTCDEPPLRFSNFFLGGCVAQWLTPYVPLDSLKAGDFTWIGYCPRYVWGCNPSDPEEGQCMANTAATSSAAGPFSLWSVPDGAAFQCQAPPTLWFASWTNCDTSQNPIQPCLGEGDFQSDCCANEFHFFAPDPPCYS